MTTPKRRSDKRQGVKELPALNLSATIGKLEQVGIREGTYRCLCGGRVFGNDDKGLRAHRGTGRKDKTGC